MENREFLLLDGAMGTMLQAAGLPAGTAPELWNLSAPEKVAAVHRQYLAAGSRVIYANTFGANRLKAAGCGHDCAELIAAGVRLAKEACAGSGARAALDMGPVGQLLEPLGPLSFEEAYDIYREMVLAGAAAGADLIVIETLSDLYEAKAALLAAKENSSLPVWVTMSFEAAGRSFLGATVPAMALTLTGLGADAVGFNCGLGPVELLPLVRELRRWTELPLILKPNAGLPDPSTGAYAMTPETFARTLAEAAELGVTALGGCCGTDPAFIAALGEQLKGKRPGPRPAPDRFGVCSGQRAVAFGPARVVGERLNPTGKKRLQRALREGDTDTLLRVAVEQQDAGAEILDVNLGLPGVREAALMGKTVKALQAVTDLPLQIDSSDPAAIEAGLRAYNGKAIVNSVNADPAVWEAVLPLCKKYGAAVIGLCVDKNGLPQTAEERLAIARRILDAALAFGIRKEDLIIDCLTLTVSAQQEQAAETLRAVALVRRELGLRTALGVSNISFGLPARERITAGFLTQALTAGLDLPILNPCSAPVMDAVAAFRALSGQDPGCGDYIRRFAQASSAPAEKGPGGELTLAEAVLRGLRAEAASLTERALEQMDGLELIDTLLIPALDEVGRRYERQELFLPQLINAANAAGAGFEVVKARLADRGEAAPSKGKILLATVQGDIHDIGKNIVRVVLENYGYTVLDLGRDVPPERVVEAAVREDVRLVGLSALMTTTVPAMEKTIAALRRSGHACRVMVGGAVLTEDCAKRIGADYYAKDARQSAEIARLALG